MFSQVSDFKGEVARTLAMISTNNYGGCGPNYRASANSHDLWATVPGAT